MSQRKAARLVYNNFSRYSSVTNMLHQLNWDFLKQRRNKVTYDQIQSVKNKFTQLAECCVSQTAGDTIDNLSFNQDKVSTIVLSYSAALR